MELEDMMSASDKDEPVQPKPEGVRRVERDEPGTVILESEPGDASRRAVEDWDHAPGEEHAVDFPDAGHREGGIAKQVLEMAPDVAYDEFDPVDGKVLEMAPDVAYDEFDPVDGKVLESADRPMTAAEAYGSRGATEESTQLEAPQLEAPRFGFVPGHVSYVSPPSLDIELTVATPDGRSFTFRESREFPDFPDDAEFEIGSVLAPLSSVTDTAYQRFTHEH